MCYFVIELDDRTLCSVCNDTIAVIRMNQYNQIKPHYSQKMVRKKLEKLQWNILSQQVLCEKYLNPSCVRELVMSMVYSFTWA